MRRSGAWERSPTATASPRRSWSSRSPDTRRASRTTSSDAGGASTTSPFAAADDAEFDEVVERLVDAGASSGTVDDLGPVRSVLFVDPDGAHHNLQVVVPGWRPGPGAEVVDADLLAGLQRFHKGQRDD